MASNPPRWGSFPTVRCTLYNCMLYANTAFGRPSGRLPALPGRALIASRRCHRKTPVSPPMRVPIPDAMAPWCHGASRGKLARRSGAALERHVSYPLAHFVSPTPGRYPYAMANGRANTNSEDSASGASVACGQGRARRAASFPSDSSRSICTGAFSTSSPYKNCIRLGQVARHKAVVSAPAQALSAPRLFIRATALRVGPSASAVGPTTFAPSEFIFLQAKRLRKLGRSNDDGWIAWE